MWLVVVICRAKQRLCTTLVVLSRWGGRRSDMVAAPRLSWVDSIVTGHLEYKAGVNVVVTGAAGEQHYHLLTNIITL